MDKFAEGDVVVLKSGGPMMAVMDGYFLDPKRDHQAFVQCVWLDRSGNRCTGLFPHVTLQHYERPLSDAELAALP